MANLASWPMPFESPAATSWWQSVAEPAGATGNGARVTAAVDDLSLLEQVAQGDVQAYRQLVERHLRGIHAFAYRMLGSRAEAEEVAQESFLRLWQEAGRFVARAKPSTWLYRVAHNLAIDRLRRRRERPDQEGIEQVAGTDGPAQSHARRQLVAAVERALAELPERQRAAIGLVHYQGLSNAEAAEVLGVGVRALESLLARARRQLREGLAEYAEADRSES